MIACEILQPKEVPVESPGMEQPPVVEGTSTGGGGWGSATGDNSRLNSRWFGMDPVSKSVNASTADLLPVSNDLNSDPTSGDAPAESGNLQLPPRMGEALPAETLGERTPHEEVHARELTTVKTDVLVVPDAATIGPSTADDLLVGSKEDGEGEGEGEGGEKAAEEEWGIPVKMKKRRTNVAMSVTSSAGDDWGTGLSKAQKKRLRERARKQIQKEREDSSRPSSGATSNSVHDSVVHEPKRVATASAPVDDIPIEEDEGVLVEGKSDDEDDVLAIVKMPDAAATMTETAANDFADDEELAWNW
ncbi:hypothetical protein H4582DRAFT_1396994 [Lactarius indigo]|nr:hypothetical protein H4582DRAFT_1396994 [Lactarius indigo]